MLSLLAFVLWCSAHLFHLTVLCLLAGSKQYSAAIAFTLALFSHLINHVNIRLQAELEEGENPVPAFQSDGTGKRTETAAPGSPGLPAYRTVFPPFSPFSPGHGFCSAEVH